MHMLDREGANYLITLFWFIYLLIFVFASIFLPPIVFHIFTYLKHIFVTYVTKQRSIA